ncbi:MAG: ComF family protein [Bacteroidaceae bacterium]|nr:ComF family protein [Bacteroidaceae bacterium]
MKWMEKWGKPILDLLFPRYCAVCGNRLYANEHAICEQCLNKMPRSMYHTWEDNPMIKQFWGKFPTEKATAWFYYTHGSPYAHMIHLFKYHKRKKLAFELGQLMASEIKPSGFFDSIDCIIPIPLHKKKEKQRGYNQSEWLSRGIENITGINIITNAVERTCPTMTQTHKSAKERFDNMQNVFRAINGNRLKGKHILLVDDVMTTSATLTACADSLRDIEGIRFSFLTLALSGQL